jgi:hypothetical protein
LWVIQEVVLSSKAVVVCGDHRIDWKTFYEAAVFFWYCPALSKKWNNAYILLQLMEIGHITFDKCS